MDGRGRKRQEIYWESKKSDGWLVFYIVIVFLLGTGALFGYAGTKWVMEKQCLEERNQSETK